MRMIFGELDGSRSRRAEDFLALCLKAGFDATLSDQILTELWMKFVLLATNASMTALARQPIGQLRDDSDIRPVFIAAYQEVIDVARAGGVALPSDALDKILEFNGNAPPAMRASMALDLDRGNRLELPWLGGKVAELGRQLGVPTPTHSVMYAMLKPYVMGAKDSLALQAGVLRRPVSHFTTHQHRLQFAQAILSCGVSQHDDRSG